MPTLRTLSLSLLLAVAGFAITTAAPVADAQTLASSASLSGSVSDPSGARVATANVALTSPEKGITRAFKTDAEGNFSFSLLPAATYTLTVSAPNFKTFRQEGIALEVGQSASQTITMTLGTAEQVEVTSAAPLLQTENANVGAEISTKQVTRVATQSPQRIQLCRVELVGQQSLAKTNDFVWGTARLGGPGRLVL
jgi:hypothetical protein